MKRAYIKLQQNKIIELFTKWKFEVIKQIQPLALNRAQKYIMLKAL